ncbi:uncharacterized protein [Spinacia oleracea]|uniref:Reverse transcriptase domain-containing protein n=1 Tax=Spinacia oleracea TaxID=3562 RepID=A0ABM3R8Y7_SPIOL|nr:uncharacterized protein LOC130467551 [Spinacia oleracea]
MKICMWNVRGENRNLFLSHAKEIVFNQNPDIFIFLETKADGSRARETMLALKFSDFRVVRPIGTRGGIWMFWKKTVDMVLFDAENTYFHSLFHFKNLGKEGLVTAMHAPSSSKEKHHHWNSIRSNLPPKNIPWLVLGDMNEITSQSEKMGGRPFRVNQGKDMLNFMDEAGLVDLGFNGSPFTWTNARDGHNLIQERLDRALANSPWMEAYPHTKGREAFLRSISVWNHNVFGNLKKQKKELLARIDGIQIALGKKYYDYLVNLEKILLQRLNDILNKERLIWAQKSGMNWRKYGDYNTKYFHMIANIKKSRGKILTLKNNEDVWITDEDQLKTMATDYFQNLFTTTKLSGNLFCHTHSNFSINHEENNALGSIITMDEVHSNLFAMDPIKSPGPDGIQPIFFQKHWAKLGHIIYDFCNSCFCNGKIPEDINRSYIALIPKNACPSTIAEFRPIGLCNTIYKLITKIISSRLKTILGRIISPFQSSFIHGRGIEDNVILVKEMAHHFHKKSVIIKPSRGIRQGDPLSSYIFVLCLDRLSTLIENAVHSNNWKPIAITKTIRISHVFYADDVFLFSIATKDYLDQIMNTLNEFGQISGLKISMSKSTLIFPANLHHSIREDIAGDYGFKISSSFGKYLGVDIRPNKLKISNYLALLDKSMERVRGWQAKLLNMAGRCTLIKSVLNSYPLYDMQTNILPTSITSALDKCCRKFLWNKVDRNRYMARLSWEKVTRPINMGGLGIRRLKEWNLAFMAKLGWTILTNSDKLWVKILKEKYLKHSNFLNCFANNSHSPLWRDILKGRSILEQGIMIGIGNGNSTFLWYHHWVGDQPLYKTEEQSGF